ncbi:MAG TPA: NAD-dependent epimerase/dehydratase family protein [Ktedonobacterales bacterium]
MSSKRHKLSADPDEEVVAAEDDAVVADTIAGITEDVIQTTDGLERLRGRRLLLTGGTGFIGTWLLETIATLNGRWDEPCQVYVPTRDVEAFARKAPHLAARPEFTWLAGDIATFAVPETPCDFVIHAAASASPLRKERTAIEVGTTIVEGTRRMLDLALEWRVEGMLFLSSGAVYGRQPADLERVPEAYPGGPDLGVAYSTYAEGKRYAETLCVAYQGAYGVPVTIARPFTFVGPYQDLDAGFAATDFVRDGLRGQPIVIAGDGTAVRSYCGPADLSRALWSVLFRGRPGRAYNVGADTPVTIRELAERVVAALDQPIAVEVRGEARPGQLPERYLPDITRLRQELGIAPRDDLDDVLRRTARWAARRASIGAGREAAGAARHGEEG